MTSPLIQHRRKRDRCLPAVGARLLALWLLGFLALPGAGQAQDDGGTASSVAVSAELPESSGPSSSLVGRTPTQGQSRALYFDQRVYGNRNFAVDPVFRAGDVASLDLPDLDLSLSMPSFSSWTDVELPFAENKENDEVLVHLGPLSLDVDRFVASVLLSDNTEQTKHGRHAGIASVIGLQGIRAAWELTDNTEVSLEGDLILAPFEKKMGLNGFGMPSDDLSFVLGNESFLPSSANVSSFRGEIASAFEVGGWDIALRDSFGFRNFELRQEFDTYMEEELTMLELGVNPGLEGWRFDVLDDAGYGDFAGAYTPPLGLGQSGEHGEAGAEVRRNQSWDRTSYSDRYGGDNDNDDANLEFTNNLSLTITHESEASIRPVVQVFRRDSTYWYADGEDEETEADTRAPWYEGATLGLVMDRPSMRFPPYVSYTITRDGDVSDWSNTWRLGILGPSRLTDYLFFSGNIGLHTRSEAQTPEDEKEGIYEFHLAHQPRPMTLHSLDFVRFVQEPEDELRRQATYRLHQGLGPRLTASFVASRSELERNKQSAPDEEKWGLGGSLRYTLGDFSVAWRSIYKQEWDEGAGKEPADWEHQISTRFRLAPGTWARYEYTWEDEGDEHDLDLNTVLYRHRELFSIAYRLSWRDSAETDQSYYENLLVLTVVREMDGWSLSDLFGGRSKDKR